MKKISCHLEAESAGRWKEKLGGGGYIENAPLRVVSYPQVYEWLTKIVGSNGIGYC